MTTCHREVAMDYSALYASPLRGRPKGRSGSLDAAVRGASDRESGRRGGLARLPPRCRPSAGMGEWAGQTKNNRSRLITREKTLEAQGQHRA